MPVKALILDLDNTVYPVSSVGETLFSTLIELIRKGYSGNPEPVLEAIMRIPFQKVAEDFAFSEQLRKKAIKHLKYLRLEEDAEPFPDYAFVRQLPVDRFLVTAGFTRLQQSKVEKLGIRQDFREIFIVDPLITKKGKKEMFEHILQKYTLAPEEALVIGDDEHSEIRAAIELGIRAWRYDREAQGQPGVISTFAGVKDLLT